MTFTRPFGRLAPATLPITLETANTRLQFVADATVDVKFGALRDKAGATFDWTITLDDPGFNALYDGKLWRLEVTAAAGGATSFLGPADATDFRAYTSTGMAGVQSCLFEWSGVGNATVGRYTVSCLFSISGENVVARGWVTRAKGNLSSLDKFWFPFMVVKGPAPVDVTHIDGQKKARLLTPTPYVPSLPVFQENATLWLWSFAGASQTANHPNGAVPPNALTSQHMQFMALCALDSADAASYLRTLMVRTTDTAGYRKTFLYTGIHYTGDEGWILFCPQHWPRWSQELGYEERNRWTETDNEYAMPYEVVIGPFTAVDQSWWYDVCERYRDWAEGAGHLPAKIGSNPLLNPLVTQPALLASYGNAFNVAAVEDATYWNLILARHKGWRNGLAGSTADIVPAPKVMHTQRVLEVQNATETADTPVADYVMPGLSDMQADAAAAGMSLTMFVTAQLALKGQIREQRLPGEARYADRAGNEAGTVYSPQIAKPAASAVHYSEPSGQAWLEEMFREYISSLGLAGLYGDVFAGNGNVLAYFPGQNEYTRSAPPHGGNGHSLGKQAILTRYKQSRSTPPVFFTEYPEETIIGLTDLSLEGYNWLPGHMLISEDQIGLQGGAIADSPMQGRDWHPPLWQCVYHQYAPTIRYGMALTALNLATSPISGGGDPGMSAAELRDAFAMIFAGIWSVGMNPALSLFLYANHDNALWLDDGAGGITIQGYDASLVGVTIREFVRTLWETQRLDFAGDYLIRGKMRRPLAVTYEDVTVTKQTNPIAACLQCDEDPVAGYGLSTTPFSYYATGPLATPWSTFAFSAFDVPAVMHNCWDSSDGTKLLIALVNWTNAAADWAGTFDPTLYGFTGPVDLTRLTPSGGALIANIAGTEVLFCGSGVGTIDIGAVGARSVALLEVTGPR